MQSFIKKIKEAEELTKGPKLLLDKDASKRFIHNALSADQVYVDALKAEKKSEVVGEAQVQTKSRGKRGASVSKGKKNKRQREQ